MVVEEVGAAGEVESSGDGGEVGRGDGEADVGGEVDEGADEGDIGMLAHPRRRMGQTRRRRMGLARDRRVRSASARLSLMAAQMWEHGT